jgi:hypothetical protein
MMGFTPLSRGSAHPARGDLVMRRLKINVVVLAALLALGACACRAGYVGPYGGVHPGRCWIF